MAELLTVRNRGRKKEQLRIEAADLAAKVAAAPGATTTLSVEVAPAKGNKKAEVISVPLPKGSVSIPVALTSEKSDENAREQLRLAAQDAGVRVSIRSGLFRLSADPKDAEPRIAWFFVPPKPKAEKAAPKKATSKPKPKRS